jgi:aminomethyltransferase
MAYNHMYMPMAYGRDPADEYAALTERVTLWDVGAQRQCQLRGPDAGRLADRLASRDLSTMAVGECRYGFICDPSGTVVCDPVMLRPFEDTYWLSHGNVDLLLWAQGVAVGAEMDVEVTEPDIPPLQVQGPRSADVMAALTGGSTDRLGHFRCMPVAVVGIDCVVSRTGWSHELGYEIYPLGSERALELWDAVVEAGEPHDMMITGPNIARAVESGITDTNLATGMRVKALEANPRLVDLDAGDFVGREALRELSERGVERRQVGLLGPKRRLPRLDAEWALRLNGEQVGATRWVTFSPRLGRAIAIGLVRADLAEPGLELQLDHPGGGDPVEVTELPFVQRTAQGG